MYINSVINNPNLVSSNYQKQLPDNIHLSTYLDYQVIHLSGEIEYTNSGEIRRIILQLLKEDCSLLIDFSSLTFIDTSIMAILVEALKIAKSTALSLSIIGATGNPLLLLKLTHLNLVFTLFNRLEDVQFIKPL